MKKRIDFYITNPNHHWENFRPIMVSLIDKGYSVRLVSLCEFRRMHTPTLELKTLKIPVVCLFSLNFKNTKTSTGKKFIGGNKSIFRNLLRRIIWFYKLRGSLVEANRALPAIAIIPNDIAYPMDRIFFWLKHKKVSTILFQEGIRFPLPNEVGGPNYGSSGTDFIYTWGENSKNYFESISSKRSILRVIGNPRFDEMLAIDNKEIVKELSGLDQNQFNLLYASNPVDDQGFCSHQEKLNLFKTFLSNLSNLQEASTLKIWLRLHPREDESDFQQIISTFKYRVQVEMLQSPPLFACLKQMDGCIVLASTVGLESLLNNIPLAVVKLPNNYNYVFDYVNADVAIPLDVHDSLSVANMLKEFKGRSGKGLSVVEKEYVAAHIANIGSSKEVFTQHLLKDIKDE